MADNAVEPLMDNRLQALLENAASRLTQRSQLAVGVETLPRHDDHQLFDPSKRLVAHPLVTIEDGVARAHREVVTEPRNPGRNGVVRHVKDLPTTKLRKEKHKMATAGANWYDLSRTILSPAVKRDYQLLQMRNALDPHRHYRKLDNAGKIPEFSQRGTIIEGPSEFFSARIQKRERRQTLAEELLASEKSDHRFKSKYDEIQAKKMRGRASRYKSKNKPRDRRKNG